MTQPNEQLISTIEKALEAARIPYSFNENNGDLLDSTGHTVADFIYHDEDAYLIANTPEWLRALLEENKRLIGDKDFWYQLCTQERELFKAQKDHMREELEQAQQKLKDYEGCKGIEAYYRVLSELRETREELEKENEQLKSGMFRQANECARLKAELEQVKADRDEQNKTHLEQLKRIDGKLDSILSQYHPRRTTDET